MDIQQLLTVFTALVAAGYLLWRGVKTLRGRGSGCGSCASCPSDPSDDKLPVRKQLYSLGDDDKFQLASSKHRQK